MGVVFVKKIEMKKVINLLLVFIVAGLRSYSGVIVIEGKYYSKNLFIQNGIVETGVGYCTYEVLVNGEVSTDEVNSSAFEVDFSQFQIKPGTTVTVEIRHKDGCRPKILNPEALKSQVAFDVVSMTISKNGILNWTTKNENGALPFIIEQFKWNKWVPVGEVEGVGTPETHEYSYVVAPNSGENKFRVKQTGFAAKSKCSLPIVYISASPKVNFMKSENSDKILFSSESMYEVYDDYGNILKKGYSKQFDITNLSKGNYILCYDNSVTEFSLKK